MAKNAVDTKHRDYMRKRDTWQMVRDCVEGSEAVKFRKDKYLPHPNGIELKSKDHRVVRAAEIRYNAYIARARFLNATGRTTNGMLGIAFGKPVSIKLTGQLAILETDADGKGQPITQLMRDMLAEALMSGRGYLLGDYDGSGEQTAETQGRSKLRFFRAEQVINWRVSNGKTSLVVLEEEEEIDNPEEFINSYRMKWTELRLINGIAHVRVWTQDNLGKQWVDNGPSTVTALVPLRDKTGAPLTELPGCWLGSVNNDAWPDPAPMGDIADLNIGHYQADADVCEAAHIAGQPTLVLAGLTSAWAKEHLKEGVRIGSTSGILLNETGTAQLLQANETNMSTNLKEQRTKEMAMLGAKLLERGTAAKTATQASFEAETDNSILSLCATNVESCLNKVLEILALMVPGDGHVEVNKRYEIATIDGSVLTVLVGMVQSGTLSLENFIRYQQSIGLISDDLKPEEVIDALHSQPPLPGLDLMAQEMQTRNDNTAPPEGGPDGQKEPAE